MSTQYVSEYRPILYMFRFSRKVGYTIWAEIDRDDLLFALSGNLILFSSRKEMSKFIPIVRTISTFSRVEETTILQFLKENKFFELENYFNYPQLLELLQGDWADWELGETQQVLIRINMLWDICVSINRQDLSQLFKAGNPLCDFADFLTFITEDELPKLAEFDKTAIVSMLSMILEEVEQHIFIVS